ncbi:MAG: 1,4-alpha-glucan branching enzyme, partial [Clostridia bacterium]|nr:1,4-alpha-glucan branching enzyme [Clostridia bacterium]
MQQNDLAPYLFHQGTNFKAHDYLGVHKTEGGYVFRVWAPHAVAAFVVGDFNGWGESDPMVRATEGGVFECTVSTERFGQGCLYKFKMKTPHGDVYKADPYGTYAGQYPETASIYFDIDGYPWRDDGWLRYRRREAKKPIVSRPLNI